MKRFENEKDYERVRRLSPRQTATLTVNFLWMIGVYYLCVSLGERAGTLLPYQICTGLYASAAIILGAFSLYLSGKIFSEKEGSHRTEKQKKAGKLILLFVLPLIAVLLIDFIDLFVVEYVKRLLSAAR